jgi:hypothetical protein
MPQNTDGRWTGVTTFNVAATTIDDGQGHTMTDNRGFFVLHAALMHTGKVLCFSGHVEVAMYAPLSYLFDPATPSAQLTPIAFPPGADLFCCHYVTVPDGKLLALGGSQHDAHHPVNGAVVYRGSTGSKTIGLFDPVAGCWSLSRTGCSVNELKQGRWYPTAVLLADGRVAVFSGRRELDDRGDFPSGVGAAGIADMVEILSPPDWSSTELTGGTFELPIYPGMHLAKDGRIYFTHTNWGQQIASPNTRSLLIAAGATSGTWTDHGVMPPHARREEGMSVLLPPAQDGKILVIGGSEAQDAGGTAVMQAGGPADFHHMADPTDPLQADVLDTTTSPPTWTSVGPMNFGRTNGHCVILPDATVLICGGHDNYKWQDSAAASYPSATATNPSLIAEIFDPTAPAGSQFHTVAPGERGDAGASMGDPRMYHSVALLLPDGRVFTAGGADPNREEPPPGGGAWDPVVADNFAAGWVPQRRYGPGTPMNVKTFEFYEPPYFFKGTRPTITDVLRNGCSSRRFEWGQTLVIRTAQAADIVDVALIRPCTPTHHTDSEQRFVRLTFTKGAGELTVTIVNDRNLIPPGYYMLWIVDDQKRPCQRAEFIRIVPPGSSCFVATAAYRSPDHPRVEWLRALREELRQGTRAGRVAMAAVTRAYMALGPRLAARMDEDEALRQAVRERAVSPIMDVIGASERLARKLGAPRRQHAALLALLGLEALCGAVAAPFVLASVARRAAALREATRTGGAAGAKEAVDGD